MEPADFLERNGGQIKMANLDVQHRTLATRDQCDDLSEAGNFPEMISHPALNIPEDIRAVVYQTRGKIDTSFGVSREVREVIDKLTARYQQALADITNGAHQQVIAHLTKELDSAEPIYAVAAALALVQESYFTQDRIRDQQLRIAAVRTAKRHAQWLELSCELYGRMDIRKTIYGDGMDTPAALALEFWRRSQRPPGQQDTYDKPFGVLVLADDYSVDGLGEAFEAAKVLGGIKIGAAVTVDFAEEEFGIEFGHLMISLPVETLGQCRRLERRLSQDPMWQNLQRRHTWHWEKIRALLTRWNQLHPEWSITEAQLKRLSAFPRASASLAGCFFKLYGGDLSTWKTRLRDPQLYEPVEHSLTNANVVARLRSEVQRFSIPLSEVLAWVESMGGATFIPNPAERRTLMGLEPGRQGYTPREEERLDDEAVNEAIVRLERLLTKYHIHGLEVYNPLHTQKQVERFNELATRLAEKDERYHVHGLPFIAGTNGWGLEVDDFVYGKRMSMPPTEWADQSRWKAVELQWRKAREIRDGLCHKAIQRSRLLSLKSMLEQRIWDDLLARDVVPKLMVRHGMLLSCRLGAVALYETLQKLFHRLSRAVKRFFVTVGLGAKLGLGPRVMTVEELTSRPAPIVPAITDTRIIEAVKAFVGHWRHPEKRILVLDVDGTIASGEAVIPPPVLTYLMAFMLEGIDIAWATGRGNEDLLENATGITPMLRPQLHLFPRTSALGYGFNNRGKLVTYYTFRLEARLRQAIEEELRRIREQAGEKSSGIEVQEFPDQAQMSLWFNALGQPEPRYHADLPAFERAEVVEHLNQLKERLRERSISFSDEASQQSGEASQEPGQINITGPNVRGGVWSVNLTLGVKTRAIWYMTNVVRRPRIPRQLPLYLLIFADGFGRGANDEPMAFYAPESTKFAVGPLSEEDLVRLPNTLLVTPHGWQGSLLVFHEIAKEIVYVKNERRNRPVRAPAW